MISFALLFSLLGLALTSCAVITDPVVKYGACAVDEKPLVADIAPKGAGDGYYQFDPFNDYKSVTGVGFDIDNSIWLSAVNPLEGIHDVTWKSSDHDLTLQAPAGGRLFCYVTSIGCTYVGSQFLISDVTLKYSTDTRSQGWYNNLANKALNTPFAFYCDDTGSQVQNRVYGNPYPLGGPNGLSWFYGMGPWSAQWGSNSSNGRLSLNSDYLNFAMSVWATTNIQSIYNQASQNLYDQGYQNGVRSVQFEIDQAYADGYRDGTDTCSNAYGGVGGLFIAIADVPITILNGLGGFAFFDIPIMRILVSFMLVGIICYIIKRFI